MVANPNRSQHNYSLFNHCEGLKTIRKVLANRKISCFRELPTNRKFFFFLCLFPEQDKDLDISRYLKSSLNEIILSLSVLRMRKPMLLLLLPGLLLLRLATRQLLALLFQLPPRFKRLDPLTVFTRKYFASIFHYQQF